MGKRKRRRDEGSEWGEKGRSGRRREDKDWKYMSEE